MLFKPEKFVEEQIGLVSEKIKGKAIIACSGGVDSVVAAMQNFAAPCTSSWMRTQTIPNHNHERYVDSVEEYICRVIDDSANTPMTGVNGDVIVPEHRYVTLNPVVSKDE